MGNTGDLSCLEHAMEPSPPRSADGSSAAGTPPSGSPEAGLWKAPLDCSFYPGAVGALATAAHRSHSLPCTGASCISWTSFHPLLSFPLSTACCIRPCCHTLRRRSSTVRTLCLRREKWDHDPTTVRLRILIRSFFFRGFGREFFHLGFSMRFAGLEFSVK